MTLFGQAPPARPEFEVASIKPSVPGGANQIRVGMRLDGSQVGYTRLSLNDYLGLAYNVKNYQISGPDWMASQRFDITAKLPADGTAQQTPEMLRPLLEDRFQMKMHREKRGLPVYGLVAGEGRAEDAGVVDRFRHGARQRRAKGVDVAASGGAGGVTVNYGNGAYFTVGANQLRLRA